MKTFLIKPTLKNSSLNIFIKIKNKILNRELPASFFIQIFFFFFCNPKDWTYFVQILLGFKLQKVILKIEATHMTNIYKFIYTFKKNSTPLRGQLRHTFANSFISMTTWEWNSLTASDPPPPPTYMEQSYKNRQIHFQ